MPMHKAIEYEAKYGKDGKRTDLRWSVGPVLITTIAGVILALSGHTIWSGILAVVKEIKSW